MSRIGKLPVHLPAGVTVNISSDNVVTVKGPLGELQQKVDPDITVKVEGTEIHVTIESMLSEERQATESEVARVLFDA